MAFSALFLFFSKSIATQEQEGKRVTLGGESFLVFSDVDDAREFLDAVEKDVALLDGGLVLVVLGIGPVCLDDATHFVDPAVKTPGSDEASQLPVVK